MGGVEGEGPPAVLGARPTSGGTRHKLLRPCEGTCFHGTRRDPLKHLVALQLCEATMGP